MVAAAHSVRDETTEFRQRTNSGVRPVGTFDLLAYTAADSAVPSTWEESDARLINKSAEVKLRSFSTKVSPKWDLALS